MSIMEKLANIAKIVFHGDPEQFDLVMAKYAKPPTEDCDEVEFDPEMSMLYEEMAVTDQVNASDLKAWKNDLDKNTMAKLNKEMRKARHDQMQQQIARKV